MARGVAFEQLLLDPGPDFSKTPAQTIEVLRTLPALQAIGRPVLLAVSRKDFIGALTGRGPRERLAGTLAAVAYGVGAGAHMLRLHDVGAGREFLAGAAGARRVGRRRPRSAGVRRVALGPGRRSCAASVMTMS